MGTEVASLEVEVVEPFATAVEFAYAEELYPVVEAFHSLHHYCLVVVVDDCLTSMALEVVDHRVLEAFVFQAARVVASLEAFPLEEDLDFPMVALVVGPL